MGGLDHDVVIGWHGAGESPRKNGEEGGKKEESFLLGGKEGLELGSAKQHPG